MRAGQWIPELCPLFDVLYISQANTTLLAILNVIPEQHIVLILMLCIHLANMSTLNSNILY